MSTLTVDAKVTARLDDEIAIWLTTVGRATQPVPTPVWYLWNGDEFLIFSQPDTFKLAHIAERPKVALNLDGDTTGDYAVIVAGTARIDPSGPTAEERKRYLEKYAERIPRIGFTPDGFLESYSVLIRVRPDRLRSW